MRPAARLPLLPAALLLAAGLGLTATVLVAQDPTTQDPDRDTESDGAVSLPGVLDVDLEPGETTVGGRVRATLTLVWMGEEPAEAPRFPTWQSTWGSAEVLDASPVDAFVDQSGRYVYRQEVELTAFDLGETSLPPVTVALPLAERTVDVRSEAAGFTVRSVLPDADGDAEGEAGATAAPGAPADGAGEGEGAEALELRPPAPPVPLGGDRRFAITAGALAAALAVSLWLLLRRLARNALAVPAGDAAGAAVDPLSLLPPLDELEARLGRLDPGHAEPAHTGLSLALRTFLGRSLGVQAVESTTSEIQRRLLRTPLDDATGHELVALLRQCDQVKFARADVAAATTGERLERARELARSVDALLRPAADTSGEGTGDADEREAAA